MEKTERQPMAKRLLSVLFAVTLVTGLVPVSAYAAVGEQKQGSTQGQEQPDPTTEQGNTDSNNNNETGGTTPSTGEVEDGTSGTSVTGNDTETKQKEETPTGGVTEEEEEETSGNSVSTPKDTGNSSNGLSNGTENSIQLADDGISVAANAEKTYTYNGKDKLTNQMVLEYLQREFKYGSIVKVPYASYKVNDKKVSWDSSTFSPDSGIAYSVEGSKKALKPSWTYLGTVTFQKQWTTTFTSNVGQGGAIDVDSGNPMASTLTSNDGATVQFKVKPVQVEGTDGSPVYYEATVTRGGNELVADTNGIYSFTVDAETEVKVEYKVPKASLNVQFSNATVKVGNDELTESETIQATAGLKNTAVVTPAAGYAVTSVKLSGEDIAEQELITEWSFSDASTHAATVTIPALTKDKSYTLKVQTEKCTLAVKSSPSAAVKGLSDSSKIKKAVIDGVLDLENSFPEGISAEELTVEYYAGSFISDYWKPVGYEPSGAEKLYLHKFGDEDNETIRITYAGNAQYCSLSTGEVNIGIVDGRTATHLTANESVSVKYAPEEDLKKAIETQLAPKVFADDTGLEISGAEVTFDYSGFDRKVGTQSLTIKYAGNEDYKGCELKVSVEITKGDAKVTVNSQSISYGETPSNLVTSNPEEAWPAYAVIGIDGTGNSYLSIDFSSVIIPVEIVPGVVSKDVNVQEVITTLFGNEFTANQLLGNLDKVEAALRTLGVDNAADICSRISTMLEAVNKIAPGVMDSTIVIGGTPSDAGLYTVAAVSVNPNYSNDVAVGYLTIAPSTQNVELKFKNELPSSTITVDQAKGFDFSAGLFQGSIDITSKGNVSSRFIGTAAGKPYASKEAPTEPGYYTQTITNIGGNYYAKPIVRTFTISRVDTTLTISFDGATGDNQTVVYSGGKAQPTFTVTAGTETVDSSKVGALYIGQTQAGDPYMRNTPPTEAGTYHVSAVYLGTLYYDTSSASCDLTIKPQSIDPNSADYRDAKVLGIDDTVYNGESQKWSPEVQDSSGNKLVEGTDYTVAYSTEDFTNVGQVDVTITGKGNYTGTVQKSYKINQQSIDPKDEDAYLGVQISDVDAVIVYDGTEHKYVPEVTDGKGDALTENTDYAVSYECYAAEPGEQDFTHPGRIKATITGAGNYKGTVEKTYTIVTQSINPEDEEYLDVTVEAPANVVYNGQSQQQKPVVAHEDGTALVENTDYTVSYSDDTVNAGNVTVTVKGIGYYTGTVETTYEILAQSINGDDETYAGVQIDDPQDWVYDGNEHKWTPKVTDSEGEALTENTDYAVEYETSDFTSAGEKVVTIKGMGNYTGQVHTKYSILAQSINKGDETYRGVAITKPGDVVYDGTAQKQLPVITDGEKTLIDGVDYIVEFEHSDFTNAGTVEALITGTGNYAGEVEMSYTIKAQSIDPDSADYRNVEVEGTEDPVYSGEPQKWSPVVLDANKNKLAEGTDYEVSYKRDGVATEDFTSVGEIEVTITGKGNYADQVVAYYSIDQQSINPEDEDYYQGVKISDVQAVIVYDGTEHKYVPQVTDGNGNTLAEGTDYTVSYECYAAEPGKQDFTHPGQVDVTIEGKGNYSGKVQRSYKIVRQSINPADAEQYLDVTVEAPANVVYNGQSQQQKPVLSREDSSELVEGVDYELSYSDDTVNAGTVTVTVKGIGNYDGTVATSYAIEKAAIKVSDSATMVYNGQEQMFYVNCANATGIAEGEVLTLSDAQVKGTEPGVYTQVSDYTWVVVKADGKTDSTGNYTIDVSGTLTITADEAAANDGATTDNGTRAEADKDKVAKTADAMAPLAVGTALAAVAAALVALLVSRKLRRNARR